MHVCTLVQVCPQHCNGPGSHSADGMLLRQYIDQQVVRHSGDMLLRQYVAQQMACPSFSYRCLFYFVVNSTGAFSQGWNVEELE